MIVNDDISLKLGKCNVIISYRMDYDNNERNIIEYRIRKMDDNFGEKMGSMLKTMYDNIDINDYTITFRITVSNDITYLSYHFPSDEIYLNVISNNMNLRIYTIVLDEDEETITVYGKIIMGNNKDTMINIRSSLCEDTTIIH